MTATLLIFSAFLALSLATLQHARHHAVRMRLRGLLGADTGLSGMANAVRGWLERHVPGAADENLRQSLMRAGFFQPEAAPVFILLRLLGAMTSFGLVLALRGTTANSILLAVFAAFIFGRILPIFLKLRAEARGRALRRELPPVIDMLLMVLQSGVSIDQCLRHVSTLLDHTAPLTALVLRRYTADTDSGMPYEQAFDRLGQRLGIEEGHDLAAIIKQALLQGGEITAPLERFGTEMAEKRLALAREQVGRRSLYLTVVMLAFFMPVLLVTLAGPAASTILSTLGVVKQQLHHKEAKR